MEINNENVRNFEFSDFLDVDEWLDEDQAPLAFGSVPNSVSLTMSIDDPGKVSGRVIDIESSSSSSKRGGNGGEKKKEAKSKVAFRTKSDLEILDDGFRWRKYGKKMVKNSPHPRNYYRCLIDGCPVKKRVERDVDDPNYVVTTYEGIHNHESSSL